ncbi:hypothetical protein QBC42DRAFT_76942 [Cladorrhinum samala]|uniref:Tudor domain-containing protein n=1 Tax=Cladorrhinum samala TaxID=585594 RepID=A0AAV9HPZ9_9PEZI|nr:hypothetical protein QBC42DRAFT_76942 [Cladorrhinum samala]
MSAQLEAEKKDFESQLELVVTSLKDDPDNVELANLKTELEGMIQFINDSIAELKPKSAPATKSRAASPPRPPPPPPPPADEQPKWSRENHPAFKKATAAAPEPEPQQQQPEVITYQVNDTVMAKWMTGDKGFYPARITSITGSSTNPIYTVKFKSYDTVETLRAKDIRPMAAALGQGQAQKRKADSMSSGPAPAPAAPTTTTTTNNGIVLSATPELYPQPPPKPEGDNEKPKPKFKKIKANKELEAGKNKWQEFTAKGKMGKLGGGGGGGLGGKKESMFRTPEGVKGRVGFTGSGQAMRKDPTRTRHVYQPNEDLD